MPIRIGGLSSGTDYQSMVDQMMAARRVPIELKAEKKVELDYDMGAWTEVNSKAEALTDVLDKLRSSDFWRSMKSESTFENIASASAASFSAEQKYTVTVSTLAEAQSVSSDLLDTSSDLITQGYVAVNDVFEIEGEQITIEAGETLSSLRDKINTASDSMAEGSQVNAAIVDGYLVLTRQDTGAADISLSDVTGTALHGLGVLYDSDPDPDIEEIDFKHENVPGADASFSVNGLTITRPENTGLDDVVDGLTIDLSGVGTTTIDVHPDREKVKETMLEFVDKYNALHDLVNEYSKIEQGGSSELALKGELYGDSLLSAIRTSLRQYGGMQSSTLNASNATYSYDGQSGVMDTLADIGIWTSGKSGGLSVLDESKLDHMLDYEFENVEQLFRGVFNPSTVAFEGGVASDFYKYISKVSESLTGDIATRIETLSDKYDDLSDDIAELEDGLADYEQRLWDQFTRMEDALANMESQSNYLKQVFKTG